MKVELQAYTVPVIEGVSPQDYTAYIARIGKVKDNPAKLLKYLIKHRHWSPFEHTSVTFKIQTSRAIGRELLRHRSFTFQEFSQRYEEVLSFESIQLRKQSEKNRQSSTEEFDPIFYPALGWEQVGGDTSSSDDDVPASEVISDVLDDLKQIYERLLSIGVAKECARFILPECTSTTILMTGSIRSWIHFLEVRNHPDAQQEAQDIALAIQEQLSELFPVIFEALTIND